MINKFIGSGIVFPLVVNSQGRIDIVNDNTLIESSIKNILYWPTSHRFFNIKFGSRIEEVLEEPDDEIGAALVRHFIFEAINRWEKRVNVKDVEILNVTPKEVTIQITYIMVSTRSEETMVFPFYKTLNF